MRSAKITWPSCAGTGPSVALDANLVIRAPEPPRLPSPRGQLLPAGLGGRAVAHARAEPGRGPGRRGQGGTRSGDALRPARRSVSASPTAPTGEPLRLARLRVGCGLKLPTAAHWILRWPPTPPPPPSMTPWPRPHGGDASPSHLIPSPRPSTGLTENPQWVGLGGLAVAVTSRSPAVTALSGASPCCHLDVYQREDSLWRCRWS